MAGLLFDKATALVEARGCPAQLCVLWRGEVVLDRAFGCDADSLFFLFSASKPMVALLVHQLAERGVLSLDDPVADYWPEFAQQGKAAITIRQVLQHRSGLPVATTMPGDAIAMTNWRLSVRNLERARPAYPPGLVPAYHILSYGFLLGELVQRATGQPVRDMLAAQILEPLGLRDTHLGLPPPLWPRHVPVGGRGAVERATALVVNTHAVRRAVIPAASVSATARDLAHLYQALLDAEHRNGLRFLQAETILRARTPSSDGEVDQYLKLPVRWSEGFQLGGERPGPARLGGGFSPMGTRASRTTFGHNGSYVCIGWADPQRRLAVGYVTGRLVPRGPGARHMSEVSDAIIEAVGG